MWDGRLRPVGERNSMYVYVDAALASTGELNEFRLGTLTERHRLPLQRPALRRGDVRSALAAAPTAGLILEMARGWPNRVQLGLAARALVQQRRLFLYWPTEETVELLDADRLGSYGLLWARVATHRACHRTRPPQLPADLKLVLAGEDRLAKALTDESTSLLRTARPAILRPAARRVVGTGAYLRTDFWAPITTGGSYGHTCYVAAELARSSDSFLCLLPHRFDLLDALSVPQVSLSGPVYDGSEAALLAAGPPFRLQLRPLLEALRPAYIYERLCLGNMVGAQLAAELQIPYLIEYNGSEISMRQSFEGSTYKYADLFEHMERAAFAQATAISVISDGVLDNLVARGVDPSRILVNPNGADPETYSPPNSSEREAIRAELGFGPADRVVGFIGTFGGWHGIDVLARALPLVGARSPTARFLMIGDGQHRCLIEDTVEASGLQDRVVLTGRVAHAEGAKLLGACDLFVSPHSANMIDSPFFGSPTKLFEYMGLARGIVASDLEQIGEVLRPGLKPSEVGVVPVTDHRAVLCPPGQVDALVEGVVGLIEHPSVADALGANARAALLDSYTWRRHVERLWNFVASRDEAAPRPTTAPPGASESDRRDPDNVTLATADAYKGEVQRQWDADPCGSHYVTAPDRHTLEWYLEAERYRYEEYAPWMADTMGFADWNGRQVLEIGAGMGTDLAQFARHGATVTDYDLSAGHLERARENFALRGLQGTFLHGDAEELPFDDDTFDLVYSNGVIHHTPNTHRVVAEAFRVLKPGGQVTVMVYAERSVNYWSQVVGRLGLEEGMLATHSVGEIMSRHAELSTSGARPLVKVYTARRVRRLFAAFESVSITRRQLLAAERPGLLRLVPTELLGQLVGWNLVVKGRKPV